MRPRVSVSGAVTGRCGWAPSERCRTEALREIGVNRWVGSVAWCDVVPKENRLLIGIEDVGQLCLSGTRWVRDVVEGEHLTQLRDLPGVRTEVWAEVLVRMLVFSLTSLGEVFLDLIEQAWLVATLVGDVELFHNVLKLPLLMVFVEVVAELDIHIKLGVRHGDDC